MDSRREASSSCGCRFHEAASRSKPPGHAPPRPLTVPFQPVLMTEIVNPHDSHHDDARPDRHGPAAQGGEEIEPEMTRSHAQNEYKHHGRQSKNGRHFDHGG